MHCLLMTLIFAVLAAANPVPGGVTGQISPPSPPPAGCCMSYSGTFSFSAVNITSPATSYSEKRTLEARDNNLICTLQDGVLKDQNNRTGYIASNQQLQFDDPPQAGAIYTSGFSICANGSLALGGDVMWVSCPSGGFSNLYLKNTAPQCYPVYIHISGSGSPTCATGSATGTATATTGATGMGATATAPASAECTVFKDGQPQCSSASPAASPPTTQACSQYGDGQPQCSTVTPTPSCSEYGDGQPQCSSSAAQSAGPTYTGPISNNTANGFGLQRDLVGVAVGLAAVALF